MNRAPRPILIIVLLGLLAASCWLGWYVVSRYASDHRGIETGPPIASHGTDSARSLGADIDLRRASDADTEKVLTALRDAGITWVRQKVAWADVEPVRGQYDWKECDRLTWAYAARGMRVLAVLVEPPEWARVDALMANSPPEDTSEYALFVAEFARRYAGRVDHLQIWDEPNIYPNWGYRKPDPAAYVSLLREASLAARDANPNAVILSAALAPTIEDSIENMNDLLYLRRMYKAGAAGSFDVLAAQPLGFYSGPEDRRVDQRVLNFSRVIGYREAMREAGDAERPIWATAFGWVALPDDWRGRPSPWGATSEATQAEATIDAVLRAREEWRWMGPMFVKGVYPWASDGDPLYGFSILDRELRPRPMAQALQSVSQTDAASEAESTEPWNHISSGWSFVLLALSLAVGLLSLRQLVLVGARALGVRPLSDSLPVTLAGLSRHVWSRASEPARQAALVPVVVLGLTIVYMNGSTLALCLGLLIVCGAFALRPVFGLGFTLFAVPFALAPIQLISGEFRSVFSLLELLIVANVAAWLVNVAWGRARLIGRIGLLDIGAVALVGLGVLSLAIVSHQSDSVREFRTILLEPVLFYWALTRTVGPKDLRYLSYCLVSGGVAISLFGIFQYLFTESVITAEGVRRMKAFYGSPNNLALYLGRVIPLTLALAYMPRWRVPVLIATATMLVALLLTFSIGGWLGLLVALLVIAVVRRGRTLWAMGAALVLGIVGLIPALRIERIASHLGLGEGSTSLLRVDIWRAAIDMAADQPVWGVGLDGFLRQYPNYMLPSAWREPSLSHPHNLFLDFWLRLGLPGLGLIVVLLVIFVAQASSLYRRAKDPFVALLTLGLLAGMADFVTHGLIDNSYFVVDLAVLFWFSIAAVAVGRKSLDSSAARG